MKASESFGQEKLVDEYILELDTSQQEPKEFVVSRYKTGDLQTKKDLHKVEPTLKQMHAFHVSHFRNPGADWDMQRSLDHYLDGKKMR